MDATWKGNEPSLRANWGPCGGRNVIKYISQCGRVQPSPSYTLKAKVGGCYGLLPIEKLITSCSVTILHTHKHQHAVCECVIEAHTHTPLLDEWVELNTTFSNALETHLSFLFPLFFTSALQKVDLCKILFFIQHLHSYLPHDTFRLAVENPLSHLFIPSPLCFSLHTHTTFWFSYRLACILYQILFSPTCVKLVLTPISPVILYLPLFLSVPVYSMLSVYPGMSFDFFSSQAAPNAGTSPYPRQSNAAAAAAVTACGSSSSSSNSTNDSFEYWMGNTMVDMTSAGPMSSNSWPEIPMPAAASTPSYPPPCPRTLASGTGITTASYPPPPCSSSSPMVSGLPVDPCVYDSTSAAAMAAAAMAAVTVPQQQQHTAILSPNFQQGYPYLYSGRVVDKTNHPSLFYTHAMKWMNF